ncbi:hypothetical protein PQX77_006433 [Marasmius sp. AFHP31]|nr:hypothetical protein PQX77_006433 [Marasmius sp. AFHP31]
MSLESGQYEIINAKSYISRHPVEDRSFSPKLIVGLLIDDEPRDEEIEKLVRRWTVEKVNNGYILKAHGVPTGNYEDYVHAFMKDQNKAEHWILDPVESPNPNLKFAIRTQDRKKGWIAQEGSTFDDPEPVNMQPFESREARKSLTVSMKVKCEPLSGSDGNYPSNEIFQFSKVTGN